MSTESIQQLIDNERDPERYGYSGGGLADMAQAELAALVADRDALRSALAELHAAEQAIYPTFEEGAAAQQAWCTRKREAHEAARAALSLPRDGGQS